MIRLGLIFSHGCQMYTYYVGNHFIIVSMSNKWILKKFVLFYQFLQKCLTT